MISNIEIGKRIKEAREKCGITQKEVAKKIGVADSTVLRYEKGSISKIKLPVLESIANALNVNPMWLIGKSESKTNENLDLSKCGIFPIKTKKIPLLGSIACGEPIYADECFDGFVETSDNLNADFCIRANGDSMVNARILDGDIVFICKQDMVNNGEIAAVLIDESATLKRIYYDRKNNMLQLVAENPAYKTQIYSGEDLNRIRILGKAVAFQSNIK